MQLDFSRISVMEVEDVQAHPMHPGFYERRQTGRVNDGFICVRDGSAEYEFEDHRFCVSKGDIFYLARGSSYTIQVGENYNVVFVNCRLEPPEHGEWESAVYTPEDSGEAERILMRLERRWWSPQSAQSRLHAMATLYALFELMAGGHADGYLSPDNRARIVRAKDRIQQGVPDSGFSCATLAAELRMSEVHFRRLFTRLYGVTPSQYLTAQRIRQAKVLLMESDRSVAEIAELTGYRSAWYFSRAFRRETGMAPTEYRGQAF